MLDLQSGEAGFDSRRGYSTNTGMDTMMNTMMNMLKRLYSRWCGHQIGEIQYFEGSPFVIGSLCHLLPVACQTQYERDSIRYSILKYTWTGWDWEFSGRLLVSRDELVKLLEKQ